MGNPWGIKPNIFVGTGVSDWQRISGGFSGGETSVYATPGLSASAKAVADMRRYIPAYNGTGELRPQNDEEGSFFKGLYF